MSCVGHLGNLLVPVYTIHNTMVYSMQTICTGISVYTICLRSSSFEELMITSQRDNQFVVGI